MREWVNSGLMAFFLDIDSADLSGVSGTPTSFINGKRHHGAYDIATLSDAVRAARARSAIRLDGQQRRPA